MKTEELVYDIIIVGAGITGLALATIMKKHSMSFLMLEKKQRSGGIILSHQQEEYFFDIGPHSALLDDVVEKFLNDCGIKKDIIYPKAASSKRWVLRNNTLHEIKPHPINFISTSLISTKGKIRMLAEPFIATKKAAIDESIHQFVARRFGEEIADYMLNPFIAGVYAGNPKKLSINAVFPKLVEMEKTHGSILKALRHYKKQHPNAEERKIFSFAKGLHQLTEHLKNDISDSLIENTELQNIAHKNNYYNLTSTNQQGEIKEYTAKKVVLTIPAYQAAKNIKDLSASLAKQLANIYYPPVLQLCLVYHKKDVVNLVEGFGFLVPEKEQKTFLGAIFQSEVFEYRTPKDKLSFTLFIGGARNNYLFSQNTQEQIIEKAILEFQEIMSIKNKPIITYSYKWENAIPQYEIGYQEILQSIHNFEQAHKGLHLAGNYTGGIGVSDCIKNAYGLYNSII